MIQKYKNKYKINNNLKKYKPNLRKLKIKMKLVHKNYKNNINYPFNNKNN